MIVGMLTKLWADWVFSFKLQVSSTCVNIIADSDAKIGHFEKFLCAPVFGWYLV
jgi:hypothetical protein